MMLGQFAQALKADFAALCVCKVQIINFLCYRHTYIIRTVLY
jgi:hypothetical protein